MATKKKAFTIRLEEDIIEKLEWIGKEYLGIKPSAIARNYLKLCELFLINSAGKIYSYDNSDLQVVPKGPFYKNVFLKMTNEEQIDFGDSLGRFINTNAILIQNQSNSDKVEMLRKLNWIEIKNLDGYWGFSARDFSLQVVHGLIYRLVHGIKCPIKWSNPNIPAHLSKNTDQLKDTAKQFKKSEDSFLRNIDSEIREFKEKIGGIQENYSDSVRYYKFTILPIEASPL